MHCRSNDRHPRFTPTRYSRWARASRALLIAVPMLLLVSSSADAGRARVELPIDPNARTIPANVPVTPEPGAALAFALGIGVVAWAARRTRRAAS